MGTSRPDFSSFFTAEISCIIASAMRSVHFAQASTTLLYFSPCVIRPSWYCCSYSLASERVSSTIFHLVFGTIMSSLPNEMPALNAWWKPSAMMRSQKITVSFCPQWRYMVSIIVEISRFVISLLQASNDPLVERGRTWPSITRPGVVSYQRVTSLPSASSPCQRYLTLAWSRSEEHTSELKSHDN